MSSSDSDDPKQKSGVKKSTITKKAPGKPKKDQSSSSDSDDMKPSKGTKKTTVKKQTAKAKKTLSSDSSDSDVAVKPTKKKTPAQSTMKKPAKKMVDR